MQVDHVHYERKLSDGSYGNRAMSASARIDEGDSPSEIIMMLRDLVVERLAEDEERERVEAAQRDAERMALYDAERAALEAGRTPRAEREPDRAVVFGGDYEDDDEGVV